MHQFIHFCNKFDQKQVKQWFFESVKRWRHQCQPIRFFWLCVSHALANEVRAILSSFDRSKSEKIISLGQRKPPPAVAQNVLEHDESVRLAPDWQSSRAGRCYVRKPTNYYIFLIDSQIANLKFWELLNNMCLFSSSKFSYKDLISWCRLLLKAGRESRTKIGTGRSI